jgi:dihydropyrimidinase
MLIKGGRVVSSAGEHVADVRIREGKIVEIRAGLVAAEAEPVIDAAGKLVLPGLVDPHTHFALDTGTARTADDFASGSQSAAAGGVTTYLDFALQRPGQTFQQALQARLAQIDGQSVVDYGLHLNITHLPAGWEQDLAHLVEDGVTSAKVYTTYKDQPFYVNDWTWYQLMTRTGQAGFLVQVHAENDDIVEGKKQELLRAGKTSLAYHAVARPAVAEAEAVARGLAFSRATGSPVYFVHLSNPLSVDLVTEGRERGTIGIAETCPHYLVLDESVYQGPGAERYVMTPPLRDAAMQAELWDRLSDRRIHSLGSDHCGFTLAQRSGVSDFTKISPGIPGVETSLLLLYTYGVRRSRMSIGDLVRVLCANPAKIFGLWPKKGDIARGADADLVLFDPMPERVLEASELHSKAGYSPYEGMRLAGKVTTTLCRGEVVYQDGEVKAKPGFGEFQSCQPFDRTAALR